MPTRRDRDEDEILPPHSVEAEEHCIGAVLKDWRCMANALDLPPEDFYVVKHREIWRAMRFLWERGDPIVELLVGQRLVAQRSLPERPVHLWMADLYGISTLIPTSMLIGHYAGIVREKALLRSLIHLGAEMAQRGYRPEVTSARVIAYVQTQMERLRDTTMGEVYTAERLASTTLDDLSERREGRRTSVTTGLSDLDRLLGGGLEMGSLALLMGVTGLGKTELGLQIGLHVAQAYGPVLYASLEMEAAELGHRCVRILGDVARDVLLTGMFEDAQADQVNSALNSLSRHHLVLDVPRRKYTVLNLRSHALSVQNEGGRLRMIVLDYVQRLGDVSGRGDSREQNVALMAERLKSLARELQCPVLALVQPNRDYASRRNKHPMLSDLRESGRLEIEADLVLGLYRDERLNPRPQSTQTGLAEVYKLKDRAGHGGAVDTHCTLVWRGNKYDNYQHETTVAPTTNGRVSTDVPWQEQV